MVMKNLYKLEVEGLSLLVKLLNIVFNSLDQVTGDVTSFRKISKEQLFATAKFWNFTFWG